MNMIIVNLEAGHGSRWPTASPWSMLYIWENDKVEIIAKTGEGPASIVAGDMSDRKMLALSQ